MSFADPWVKQDRQAINTSETNNSNTAGDSSLLPEQTTTVHEDSIIVTAASLEFEDNFNPSQQQQQAPQNPREPQDNRLPDSDNYLATLEKRLNRLKNNPSVLQQLAERREACMQSLLGGNTALRSDAELELESPVNNIELLRFIRPEQALSQAEIVQLIRHDQLQLEAEQEQEEAHGEGEESGTESSTSR